MCGIVGILTPNYNSGQLGADLDKAVASLHHRGPDDRGTWIAEPGIALGHTRLSILDLSPHGHQPMVSADGRYVIVFNGEIYNFAEIRKSLESMGHTFSGSGDTEVMLGAFRQWGADAVKRFIGMFAIALWDKKEQQLLLVRDRAGVKPLYYGWDGRSLCFASELKALRAFRHWTPEIDRQSLGEYLRYGYVPEPRSIYQNVHKLKPGHCLSIGAGRKPAISRYWSVLDALAEPQAASDADIESELEALLIDAFEYRMVSDVPVGVFLSGGVDSSLVTALLAKNHNQPIRTYTIGFEESRHDESTWARRVAEHCGTMHTDYILKPSKALEIAKTWGTLFDEPFADSSSIPTLLVSRMASEEVKVVLSADGGDELFSGYSSYQTVLETARRLQKAPGFVKSASRATLSLLSPDFLDSLLSRAPISPARRGFLTRRMRRIAEMLRQDNPAGLLDVAMSHWHPGQIARLLGQFDAKSTTSLDSKADPAIQISLRDFHHYLPGDILTKVDRTTMAVSIEGREPLLDHRLAEFAFRLPSHLRRGTLGPKHILKKILYRHVPRELVDRPKMGFGIPMRAWLNDELRELVDGYLAPSRIKAGGLLDPVMVEGLKRDFFAGNVWVSQPLWFLLAFELWREHWA